MKSRGLVVAIGLATMLILSLAAPAFAHEHSVNGQVIANGQNHPAFISGVSCEGVGPAVSPPVGPAWYGLETAHHGPDAGDPGKADTCYATTGGVPPAQDVSNPAFDN